MRILVIEDNAGIRDTLRDILELNGHEVVAAEDGVEGVERAAQNPDFIFCDIEMPRMNGHGVLAAIRQMPGVCDVPFVFLTARADREAQREGMSLGADDYITKPFKEHEILDAIAARTKRHLTVRERIQELTNLHKSEINAHWSHELLTPLNAVMGSLDLLEMDADHIDRSELKEILGILRQGAERQERLARKLIRYFDLERRRHAAPPAAPARASAEFAIRAGAAKAAQETTRAGDLAVSAATGDVALGDGLLADAIYEAVANALTFSPAGSPVNVTGTIRERSYRIEVCDEGPGMTAEQRTQFGAFNQFGRQKAEQQGLGLGLAIAQSTASLAGGSLALEPGANGRGLRVVFLLPLAQP